MNTTTSIIIAIAFALLWIARKVLARMRRRRTHVPTPSDVRHRGESEPAQLLHIIDGDTIYAMLADGTCESVRVIGIDAPESACYDQTRNSFAGELASDYANSIMHAGQTIWLERDLENRDRYGRLLRHVWLANPEHHRFADASMACAMVGAGHAVPMPWFPNVRYADDIAQARLRGMFARR